LSSNLGLWIPKCPQGVLIQSLWGLITARYLVSIPDFLKDVLRTFIEEISKLQLFQYKVIWGISICTKKLVLSWSYGHSWLFSRFFKYFYSRNFKTQNFWVKDYLKNSNTHKMTPITAVYLVFSWRNGHSWLFSRELIFFIQEISKYKVSSYLKDFKAYTVASKVAADCSRPTLWQTVSFSFYQGLWNVIIFSVSFRSVSQTFCFVPLRFTNCKFIFVPFRFRKNNVTIFRFRKNNVSLFRFA
jgi:hypothetical protein